MRDIFCHWGVLCCQQLTSTGGCLAKREKNFSLCVVFLLASVLTWPVTFNITDFFFSEYLHEFVWNSVSPALILTVMMLLLVATRLKQKVYVTTLNSACVLFLSKDLASFLFTMSLVYLLAFAGEFYQTQFWLGVVSHLKCVGLFYIMRRCGQDKIICLTCTRSFLWTKFGWISGIMWLPWVLRFAYDDVQRWTKMWSQEVQV